MKKVLFALIFISSLGLYGQDLEENQGLASIDTLVPNVKHFSGGLKIGFPNIIGFSLEAVSPLLNNRIAIFGDFSKFSLKIQDYEMDLSYNEFGMNIYAGNKGHGLYAGIGMGNFSADFTFNEQIAGGSNGKGASNINLNPTSIKLGVKTGSKIYFRFEVGYGAANVPETIVVDLVDNAGNSEIQTYRIHGNMEPGDEMLNILGLSKNGILIGNFGFGISF